MAVPGERQRLLLSMLNEQLTCRLCSGYFIDATTIVECLHSFCRSCIVKYLKKSKYCPICEVQVHKNKPLLNIRPDYKLQDIVYKLVPGCYQNEMRCRREFYAKHPEAKTATMSPESRGEPVESHIYSPEESLSLSLEYHNPNVRSETEEEEPETPAPVLPRRYLRCPAAVTIFHLQKLIRAKYGLTDAHKVDILYKEELLSSTYTLMDVMYIYHWRRKVPLYLSYRIFESSPKRLRLSEDNVEFKKSLSDSGISQTESQVEEHKEWKEVQLKISETGVMSVTDITSPDSKQTSRTLELEDRGKSEPSPVVDAKTSKDVTEPAPKAASEAVKDKSKPRAKEETEGTMTRSASKLNALKVEETKTKSDEKNEKPASTKMDTRASVKDAGKSDKAKDVKNDSESPNQSANTSNKESESPKQTIKPTAAGSKINALSAKLQFQPKVGQVNNTYSKKTSLKEKRAMLNKSAIKVDAKVMESPAKGTVAPKTVAETVKTTVASTGTTAGTVTATETTTVTSTSTASTTVTTSISAVKPTVSQTVTVPKVTVYPKVMRTTAAKSSTTTATTPTTSAIVLTSCPKVTSASISESKVTVTTTQSTTTQPTPKVQATVEKKVDVSATTGLPVSLSENLTISYTVKDMVSKGTSSPSPKTSTSVAFSKSAAPCATSTSTSTTPQFNIQTPVMSIYPTSMKSTSTSSSTTTSGPTTSIAIATVNSTTSATSTSSVTTAATTTAKPESKSETIPPCPDAIPLSMMKSTMRKSQLLSKGSSSSDGPSKLTTPGSKIDDICAKIGENSKEKNKLENRSKPEIPGLLEIPKKPNSAEAEQAIKQILSIHVPIFKPSCKDPSCADNYKQPLPSGSTHSQPSVSTQKPPPAKKRVSSFSYKTLRNPPRSWNPTLSKNNYLAIKNQAQQQAFACDSKPIPSKPSKIFTVRNTPRYLGNPASGVKPMYGAPSDTKDPKDQPSPAPSSSKGHTVSMTKIDPQTLQPIVSMGPTPPFSASERTYQSSPYIRSSSSPVSPRNSPVNMLSTSPFIPSPTPNTNPRFIYSTFPPSFPNASRFPHSIVPHSPLGLPPPLSAFHSSLPQLKFYQRSSYAPQSGAYGATSQPPTVQRIPPTSHSSSPKSPKVEPKSSTTTATPPADGKLDESQRLVTLALKIDRMFNLAKSDNAEAKPKSKVDFLAKICAVGIDRMKISPVGKAGEGKKEGKVEAKKRIEDGKEERKGGGKEGKDEGGKEENGRVNGEVAEETSKKGEAKEGGAGEAGEKVEEEKVKKDAANGLAQNVGEKLGKNEDGSWRKTTEQVQGKKVEAQRNKAES